MHPDIPLVLPVLLLTPDATLPGWVFYCDGVGGRETEATRI